MNNDFYFYQNYTIIKSVIYFLNSYLWNIRERRAIVTIILVIIGDKVKDTEPLF